jgi:hypothetical protein
MLVHDLRFPWGVGVRRGHATGTGSLKRQAPIPLTLFSLFLLSSFGASARGGLVNLELSPSSQVVNVGDTVDVAILVISADGNNQSVGFLGIVFYWDPTSLALQGHLDNGPFVWTSSSFPTSNSLNADLTDGDAYYRANVSPGGPYATATAGGLLVTTLQFEALPAGTGTTEITIVACDGSTCTQVSNKLPTEGGIDITGTLGAPADVTVECQSAADCNDNNPCTDDVCDGSNLCINTPNDANDPDDGLFCNGLEIACEDGVIIVDGGSIPDCDDGFDCTLDYCNEDIDDCQSDIAGDQCLIDDICYTEGALQPSNDCMACLPNLSQTSWSFRPGGAACGNPQITDCDLADTCDGAGVCQVNFASAGTACGNQSDTVCTDPDTCDGAGQCQGNHALDGTPCNDGVFCTLTDECEDGQCLGFGDPCPMQVCDESNDLCKSVRLEWRDVLPNPVPVGSIVEVGFYAASDNGQNQNISSISVILQWDPDRLRLLGKIDNGPYAWLASWFPDDSSLDGLNNTFDDGQALYQALGRLAPNPVAVATTSGLHVTTFQFETLTTGQAALIFIQTVGSTVTRVVDVDPPGLDITGPLGSPAAINVVACTNDAHCDDGEFCTGVAQCVNNSCVPGTPPDCDDGVFCNGVETCEPGVGCVSPGNPCLLPSSCDEMSQSCGGCMPPTVEAVGSRYIAVTPPPGGDPVGLYIAGDPSDSSVACFDTWLQPDGHLRRHPLYAAPDDWGTVYVGDCAIKPSTTYQVYTDCSNVVPGLFSVPTTVTTWRWGDVDNSGSVTLVDFSIVSDAADGFFGSFTVENLDLMPCHPDGVVDQQDVAAVQSALGQGTYPCPDPCVNGERNEESCLRAIPATSTWGVLILAQLLLAAAVVRIRLSAPQP